MISNTISNLVNITKCSFGCENVAYEIFNGESFSYLTPALIGSINDRIFPLANWHVVLIGHYLHGLLHYSCRGDAKLNIGAKSTLYKGSF